MKVSLIVVIVIAMYALSYLSFYNKWEWFWMPVEILGKIIEAFRTLEFIRAFPLILKYHLNPFSVTTRQLRRTLSEEDKEKFIASLPKKYKETAKEFFR
jgi:hypothetical protein